MTGMWLCCWCLMPVLSAGAQNGGRVPPRQGPPPVVVSSRPAAAAPQRPSQAPPITMLSPGVLAVGGVRIEKRTATVSFPATVNMAKGLLEYLLVGEGGKVHESLLRTAVEPYSLQVALLLIGLEGTTEPLREQGDVRPPQGDPVSITLRWRQAGAVRQTPIESWIRDANRKGPLGRVPWVFTGSFVSDGVFMAQVEKSIIAVYRDPAAMIDNPLPDGSSDECWLVNEAAVPPAGTAVTVIIRKSKKEKE
ncbi:MAG: hypothetical protein JRJ56_05115 [Deltaproteobacteria bacterium]|nr:hypothetical protein [Deltaproteobacteria bacterium]